MCLHYLRYAAFSGALLFLFSGCFSVEDITQAEMDAKIFLHETGIDTALQEKTEEAKQHLHAAGEKGKAFFREARRLGREKILGEIEE